MKEIKDFIIESGVDDLDSNKINKLSEKVDPLLEEIFTEYYGDKKEARKTVDFIWSLCETIEACECTSHEDLLANIKTK